MDNRFAIVIALVCCLFLTPSGTGQDLFRLAPDEPAWWSNPFPGIGNVSPSPVDPFHAPPQGRTLYAPGDITTHELPPTMKTGDLYLARLPSARRTGSFQKINSNTLWVPTMGSNGLGMTEVDISAMFALPMPTVESPLLLTPQFSTTFLNTKNHGSETFYTTGLGMQWVRPIFSDKLTSILGVSMLYSGDFSVRAGDALRFPAHLVCIWNFNPRTKFVLGVSYADRRDGYNVFPLGGIIWTPNEDVSIELLVPRVRIAQRIRWDDSPRGSGPEDWLYTAFEFGAGSWSHAPANGRVEYSDFRFLVGYERHTRFGLMLGFEVGYTFERKITNFYDAGQYPSDSVFLRLRSSF